MNRNRGVNLKRLSRTAKAIAMSGVLLTGCKMGPNYKQPAVSAPADFRFATTRTSDSLADLPWWEVFNDDALHHLIRTALSNNYDVRIAVTRIDQSNAIAAEAYSQLLPSVGYGAGVGDGKNEFVGSIVPTGAGQTRGSALVAVNAAWEIDLWGRIRRLNESAQAQLLATEYAKRGVMLTLVSSVAQDYFQLLELDAELQIAKDTTASFDQSLNLFATRLEGGVGNKLATARAEGALTATAAQIPELERQIAIQEDQINVLLGCNPGSVARGETLLQQSTPPDVPAGLPSSLLERRPDILQSEQLLRSANAQIGVAAANFFPQIGLTTLLGKASPDLKNFSSGSSNAWSIAANLAGPIYTGGALEAQYRQAKAAWEQAKLQYQQTALNAFLDVANALISREKFAETRAQLVRSVAAYQEAVRVAVERFNSGKANYYEVLEAQQQLFPEQNALAQAELNERLVIVQLYVALGGGWRLSDDEWSGPPTTAPAQKTP
jgi:outer membrane protein, multidrug efflux system